MSHVLLDAWTRWLGPARVDAALLPRYVTLFERLTGADASDPVAVEASWAGFVACADAHAHALHAPVARPPRVAFRARTRDRATGLHRAVLGAPLDVNAADEVALQKVPGIGPTIARAIVTRRGELGRFALLGEVFAVAPDATSSWELAADFLTVGAGPEPARAGGRWQPPRTYASFVERSLGGGAAATVAELEQLIARPTYWPAKRQVASTEIATRARAASRGEALLTGSAAAPIAFLSGSDFLRMVTRLVRHADTKIAVVIAVLRPKGVALVRALEALSTAAERGRSVRVLVQYDGNAMRIGALAPYRFELRCWHGPGTRHDPMVLVDDTHTIVGSHNWSPSSTYAHRELSTYVHGAATAGPLWTRFEAAWSAAGPPRRGPVP